MRLPIRLMISASFIAAAIGGAHAQSFAEKEFPELRKPKPVAAAPAPAPVPVAPTEKPTLIKTAPMPFAAAPVAPVEKLDPPLPPVPPKSVRVIPMPDAKSASKIAVAATPEPAPEIEAISAEAHAPPRPRRKVVRHTAPPVAVVSVRATGGMGNLDALRMPPGINSIQLGYGGNPPDMSAWADATGFHGSPPFRAADQQRSFTPNCGFVFHRFFDELGASVDRPVRICN